MELSLIIIGVLNVFIVALAAYKWSKEVDFKTTYEVKDNKLKPRYHHKRPTLTGSALFLLALINLAVFENMMQNKSKPHQEQSTQFDTSPVEGTGERAIFFDEFKQTQDEE